MIGCVIMAAGSASRFGSDKLLALLGGKPLAVRAMDAIPPELRCVIVTGSTAVAELAAERGIPVLENKRPQDGISRTVRLGTAFLMRDPTVSGILYLPADQPLLRRESVRRITEAFLETPDRICAAAADGRRGSPCVFPRDLFGSLCELTGDCGGSRVLRTHPERLRTVEIPSEELIDADTPDALKLLETYL